MASGALKRDWCAVDLDGLAKLLERRGKAFVLYELLQNAWDTNATRVEVRLVPIEGRPLAELTIVDDDPDGFRNLSHAYTLFAESEKKGDATKRGRFNLGEKLVLASCERATVSSTTGTVIFDEAGRRESTRRQRDAGTVFDARVKMTRLELADVLEEVRSVIPPIPTLINGEQLPQRTPVRSFEVTLQTEIADDEGYLRRTKRATQVRVYAKAGPTAKLYEMGIPVVELGDDLYDVEVMQKIPLSVERDNVTPGYLRELRAHVLNATFVLLRREDVSSRAVQDALSHPAVSRDAVVDVVTKQWGEKRATYDASDVEANARLTASGHAIVHGGSYSAEAWANIRAAEALPRAGVLAPTPRPYSQDPDAPARKLLPEEEWTPGMVTLAAYACELGWKLIGKAIRVNIDRGQFGAGWGACYGGGELTFNLATLGRAFFDEGPSVRVNRLLIHELSHEGASSHLHDDFHDNLEKLGAKLTQLALSNPELFRKHGWRPS